ncbi:MAG: nickel pincer cofactor biosynthesis protein LarB [Bryobacteraceae bacterium]|nr:nickel pincer cofactor biosynthesis protein LarB [Bryobacteraceae bacterium]
MDREHLKALLEDVRAGSLEIDSALERLRHMPYEDLGYAKVDHHRAIRNGMPEVIFGKGKSPEQVVGIAAKLLERGRNLLVTRATPEAAELLKRNFPEGEHFPLSGAFRVWHDRTMRGRGSIAVVCAGTSDIPVAEEAQVTAEVMGNEVVPIHDVGVAGIHRLFNNMDRISKAKVCVVVAGMEGALPSALGGLVACPVIAVPTSIGYGASFNGLAALLGMLNSCASNVTVVNIDNGFGGGYVAGLINRE